MTTQQLTNLLDNLAMTLGENQLLDSITSKLDNNTLEAILKAVGQENGLEVQEG